MAPRVALGQQSQCAMRMRTVEKASTRPRRCTECRAFKCLKILPCATPVQLNFRPLRLPTSHHTTRATRLSLSLPPNSLPSCLQEFYDAKSDTISMRSTHSDSVSEGCVHSMPIASFPARVAAPLAHCIVQQCPLLGQPRPALQQRKSACCAAGDGYAVCAFSPFLSSERVVLFAFAVDVPLSWTCPRQWRTTKQTACKPDVATAFPPSFPPLTLSTAPASPPRLHCLVTRALAGLSTSTTCATQARVAQCQHCCWMTLWQTHHRGLQWK
jgi:hypothetical protein